MSRAVSVSVRIKPSAEAPFVVPSDEGIVVMNKDSSYVLVDGFETIVEGSDQQKAYAAYAAPLVDQLLKGYSCTLMAYGQTGSGKTHTIFGPPGVLTEATLRNGNDGTNGALSAPVEWGLFPRVALELLASGKGTLHASAVEVYQERAYDLLADRQALTVGAQKTGRQIAGGQPEKDPNAAVPHKTTCSCRSCYLAKEKEKEARKAGIAGPRTKTVARSFAELSRGASNSVPGGGGAKAAGGANAAAQGRTSGGSSLDESFAVMGEKRVLLSSPADVARLARTIEHTRTAEAHLLNARSSRSHCLGAIRNMSHTQNVARTPHTCRPPTACMLPAHRVG